jgi:hypothetical protein
MPVVSGHPPAAEAPVCSDVLPKAAAVPGRRRSLRLRHIIGRAGEDRTHPPWGIEREPQVVGLVEVAQGGVTPSRRHQRHANDHERQGYFAVQRDILLSTEQASEELPNEGHRKRAFLQLDTSLATTIMDISSCS